MKYYELLKKRRVDLNLSIQDIAIQTRLNADQLRAIEENDLDYFYPDMAYVRILIQTYCKVLGVNWNFLSQEVDQEIREYQARPITQTVKREKGPETRREPVRTLRAPFRFLGSRQGWITMAVAAVVILFGVNYLIEQISLSTLEAARQEEIARSRQREEQTQALAKAIQARKDVMRNEPLVTQDPYDPDQFTVSNVVGENGYLLFSFDVAQTSTIRILEDGNLLFMDRTGDASEYDLAVDEPRTVEVQVSPYGDNDSIRIGDVRLYGLEAEDDTLTIQVSVVSGELENEDETETYVDEYYEPEWVYEDYYDEVYQ